MKNSPNIVRVASLVGDNARAAMLTALMGGEALTASELAREAGITDPDEWVELGALLADPSLGRAPEHDVTLFKSVGHAVQDLFAARAAIDRADSLGWGHSIEL